MTFYEVIINDTKMFEDSFGFQARSILVSPYAFLSIE